MLPNSEHMFTSLGFGWSPWDSLTKNCFCWWWTFSSEY